jgi:hypothetical protein
MKTNGIPTSAAVPERDCEVGSGGYAAGDSWENVISFEYWHR